MTLTRYMRLARHVEYDVERVRRMEESEREIGATGGVILILSCS